MAKLAASLAQAPVESISAASGGWSELIAACRLLNNGKFEVGELIRPHRRMVVERSDGHDCVLAMHDTTELDFTPMKTVTDLGPLNDETRRGFYTHGHYVVSEQGLPLGVLGAAEGNLLGDPSHVTNPVVSLRSTTGYRLESLRDIEMTSVHFARRQGCEWRVNEEAPRISSASTLTERRYKAFHSQNVAVHL